MQTKHRKKRTGSEKKGENKKKRKEINEFRSSPQENKFNNS